MRRGVAPESEPRRVPYVMGSILVVDDDCDIRTVLAELLTDEGYAVREACDGQEALDILATMPTQPCVVLLDMMMPRMNGTEFLRAVACTPRFSALAIVVVSAHAGRVHVGARRVLAKPFTFEAMLKIVAELCLC